MGYKRNFELNTRDIDLIEGCLDRELATLSRQQAEPKSDRIDNIRSLLGKLHNQKIWYGGSGDVARIPRG